MVGNTPVHGLVHPEGGHMLYVYWLPSHSTFLTLYRVPRLPEDLHTAFKGTCPFHNDCIEGLVANGALAARLKIPATDLPKV